MEVLLGVMLSSLEMDTVTRVQILDKADCISQSTNTFGKNINPLIPPLVWQNSMTDWVFSVLVRQPVLETENSESKPVKLHLKIDPESNPARAEVLVNTHTHTHTHINTYIEDRWLYKYRQRFQSNKERSRRYPAQTITDVDYTDDIALLVNTPAQAETLLHCLERAAAGIGLHVNADKMEYVSFNQRGNISTLNDSSLKLVDKFTYLGSSVSSTEIDINTRLPKPWIAINRLLVIWKSDLTDKIKRSFFLSSSRVDTAIWMHYMDAN